MKIFNKEITAPTVLMWLVVIGIIAGSIYFALSRNPDSPTECSVDYVNVNGSTDCENIMKANDQLESENINNYYN